MDRRTGTRLAIAAGLAIGLSFSAPQLVAGSTDGGQTTAEAPTTRIASIEDQVWPTDLHPTPPHVATVEAEPIAEPDAPDVQVTPIPAPEATVAPEAAAPEAPAPAPVVEEDMRDTGTIHVDVAATEGASRSVSLKTADGALAGGPVAVDGNRITFTEVADGTYDLYVEQTADAGGTFLTRTTLVVSGGEIVVTCDAESLDCTVA